MVEFKAIYTNTDSRGKETKENFSFSGNTKEEAFKKYYGANRTLKYCNGCYYKLANKEDEIEYRKWYDSLSESTKFDMYYGNGIVD